MMASSSFNMIDASVAEVREYLLLHGDVTASFVQNQVTGLAFLRLTEDDIKELVPSIGIRTSIRTILQKHLEVSECVIAIPSSSRMSSSESTISAEISNTTACGSHICTL